MNNLGRRHILGFHFLLHSRCNRRRLLLLEKRFLPILVVNSCRNRRKQKFGFIRLLNDRTFVPDCICSYRLKETTISTRWYPKMIGKQRRRKYKLATCISLSNTTIPRKYKHQRTAKKQKRSQNDPCSITHNYAFDIKQMRTQYFWRQE